MRKKTICFFTGSRAEYWLLRPLMFAVQRSDEFDLQLVVSGSHLSPVHGETIGDISKDGFRPDAEIETQLGSDSPVGTCKSMGLGMISYGETLSRLDPDLLVLLGDRFETFAAASAACILSVSIAHLHGGELTSGAYDDSLRHAITKMSHLHFVSTEEYRRRVIQLGESPDTVFNVGAIGISSIDELSLLDREQLEMEMGFSFGNRSVLVTFHPVTRESGKTRQQIRALLAALEQDSELHILFTGTNADAAGQIVTEEIAAFVRKNFSRAKYIASLGQLRYFSAVRWVDAVIGNSSSGIIEVPSFGVPVVNIGNRQRGRVQAESILNCVPEASAISKTLAISFSKEFKQKAGNVQNPYAREGTVENIVSRLKRFDPASSEKQFYTVNWSS